MLAKILRRNTAISNSICPFCNVKSVTCEPTYYGDSRPPTYQVICKTCWFATPRTLTRNHAIDLWNEIRNNVVGIEKKIIGDITDHDS